jgi:hypothetical protein
MCGVFGSQAVTVNAVRGSGVNIELHNADDDSSACTLPNTAIAGLTMAPLVSAAQASQGSAAVTAQDTLLDALRRLLILALISWLLFLFAPGLSAPLLTAARSRPWSRLGLGLCALVTVPVLGVVIFLVGLSLDLWWLGLLVLMFFAALLAVSMATSGLVLGAWLVQWIRGTRVPAVAAFGAGLLVLTLLGLLPTIGALVNVLAFAYGAGALMLLARGSGTRAAPALVSTTGTQPMPGDNVPAEVGPVHDGVPTATEHDAAA